MSLSEPDGATVPSGSPTVPFTASLSIPAGDPVPVGTVTFRLGLRGSSSQHTACTVALDGTAATCAIAFASPGTYDVAAFYVPGAGTGGAGTYVPSQASITVTAVAGAG